MTSRVLGIDLASRGRPLGYAVLDFGARIIAVGRDALDDDALLRLATHHRACRVAIDAPLFLPEGLCCLDDACPCAPLQASGLRAAEVALRALGMGGFATTKRTIIPRLAERGIGLRRSFEAAGFDTAEVYPHGAKVRLFGERRPPKKGRPAGDEWLRQRIARIVRALPDRLLHHDEADAILAAYTGLLIERGEAEPLGESRDGLVWLPAGPRLAVASRTA
ncbi:MAG TPA: DUF429 domain-containing protein [Dehalococcoidia bacterium]|nr:DUF429 domain-containing protein [Dehalococcoidia bacterium]